MLGFLQSRSLFSQNRLQSNSKANSVSSRSPRAQSPNNNEIAPLKHSNQSQEWTHSLQNSLMRNQQAVDSLKQSNSK